MTTYAFPGYVADVNALTGRIEATWGNAIRDRTLQIFASTALRDAAIPSPSVGQTCIITAGSAAGEYVYSGATVGWTQPWNQPWGFVSSASKTDDSNSISSVVNVGSLTTTFTAVANRVYRTSVNIPKIQQVSSNGLVQVHITDGSNTIKRSGNYSLYAGSAGDITTVSLSVVETGISAGSNTRKVRATTSAGTLSILASVTGGASIVVEDMGPNGAPS